MRHDVAGELLRVELAGRHDEVVDRLLGLDAHHDRGVAELQVEVDQQHAAACAAGERRRQRGASIVLPTPPLGENTVMILPSAAEAGERAAPACCVAASWQVFVDREDQGVGELREHHDVVDAGAERLCSSPLARRR